MSILRRLGDERFLSHRLRSTSAGGIAGGTLAALLFAWHGYVDHTWRWDLLAVALTVGVVKLTLMAWYLTRE
jgi:hypothetical protein